MMWKATYKDGTSVTGEETGTGVIDRSKLDQFELIRDGVILVRVFADDTFVYRRRTRQTISNNPVEVIYVVGNGDNLIYLRGDGVIELNSPDQVPVE